MLAGFQLSLVLFAFGGVLTVTGVDVGAIQSDIVMWGSAFDLLFVSILLLITERLVSWARAQYRQSTSSTGTDLD